MSDAENGPADDQAEGPSDRRAEPESGAGHVDDYVRRMRPSPEDPPQRVVVLSGLLGDSDRPGWRRLYLSRDLTRYAEFRDEDLVYREAIPAEQAPMRGFESSRVAVRRGARIDFIVSRQGQPLDEFDLDLRIGSRGARVLPVPNTLPGWCPGGSDDFDCYDTPACGYATAVGFTCFCTEATCQPTECGDTCYPTCYNTCPQTCNIDHTCVITQCVACPTQYGTCADTCPQTCANTCVQTCANTCPQTCANTCNTCQTQCGQATCGTCRTQCDQATCDCGTGRPHTCAPPCQVP
jgi:hypothetical protein